MQSRSNQASNDCPSQEEFICVYGGQCKDCQGMYRRELERLQGAETLISKNTISSIIRGMGSLELKRCHLGRLTHGEESIATIALRKIPSTTNTDKRNQEYTILRRLRDEKGRKPSRRVKEVKDNIYLERGLTGGSQPQQIIPTTLTQQQVRKGVIPFACDLDIYRGPNSKQQHGVSVNFVSGVLFLQKSYVNHAIKGVL